MSRQAQQFYTTSLLIVWNRSLSRSALMVLSVTLAFVSVGCNSNQTKSANTPSPSANAPTASLAASPATSISSKPSVSPVASQTPQPASDTYQKALDAADGGRTIAETAQSHEDWEVVATRFEDAIKFLKAVPASSPNKAKVKDKLTEYQRYLATAQLNASPPPKRYIQIPNIILTNQPSFKAPIKYRLHGIPVIDVTFNSKKFEMLFDTGASHTLITPYMASILTLPLVGKGVASTANGQAEFYIGLVKSMQVGSAVAQNVPVGIGAPDLDVGLFGQDFYKGYEVSVKQDAIEFRRR